MKTWIISQTDTKDTYFIPTEKAFWLSNQPKGVNIADLIENKNLGAIKSIRYEDLKDIVLIDSDTTIQCNFKDDKTDEEEFVLDHTTYAEIRSYLKNNLKGVELKDYSIFKQVIPELITLAIATVLSVITYIAALEIEGGGTVKTSGRRAFFKKIIAAIAEALGTTGTIIVGLIVLGVIAYLLVKKIQNPKKGEVLKVLKTARLTV
ncbi:FeoB-associated Cys-rich membrane protein [Seonamhaeicola marinus]|uniref:Uncharacterized protein n=1 Tax=Seonamhaeicola marinus TaxID=1912246 RepID=A0A5D0I471_9FLAO|nr:FeoB-associated Cys-rich membrane protein [Seonamhaeicola marinus]TYA78444.1 hypothetical protein FUA24_08790 [Seonamhaeicola marinus]